MLPRLFVTLPELSLFYLVFEEVLERVISTKMVLGVAAFGFCSLPQLPQPVSHEASLARFA
jgi:hypothetical protein